MNRPGLLFQATAVVRLGRRGGLRILRVSIAGRCLVAGCLRLLGGGRSGFGRCGGFRAQSEAQGGRREDPDAKQKYQSSFHYRLSGRDMPDP